MKLGSPHRQSRAPGARVSCTLSGMTSGRTFAIGDIHGDLDALERVLAKLPPLTADDTVVFLGDFVDRGGNSAGVVARVRAYPETVAARVITLRGNHEDMWVECWKNPNPAFLLPRKNGCVDTYRSFAGLGPLGADEALPHEELAKFFEIRSWMPQHVIEWMDSLPTWYEDEHAIYVHAGLDGEGTRWKHPRDGRKRPLLWMREPDFFQKYTGKRVVFGHTTVTELPSDHLGRLRKIFDDPCDVWTRNDLVGLDTGCGRGGFLSAIELPKMKVYESRE
ncbi:MAG: serine/threonine protein phosphatase [Myxococcales bacterium]|nr:serine/threonine protein phosphatase [Myxococcales bacterium]